MQDAFWNPGIYYTVSHTQVLIFSLLQGVPWIFVFWLQQRARNRERRYIIQQLVGLADTLHLTRTGKAASADETPPDAGVEPASDAMLETVAEAIAHVDDNLDVLRVPRMRRRKLGAKR